MAKGRNWDAAKRREWRNEARREKAMERRHEAIRKQAEFELGQKSPATRNQLVAIRKHGMHTRYGHDEAYLETLTKGEASALMDQFSKDNNWKPRKKKPTKKVDTSTFKPWRSGDIKITNTKTGEVRYERNQFRGKPKKSNRTVTNSSGEQVIKPSTM